MDIQLQELIDKIKKDGVGEAEKKAAEILAEAEKKAQGIISDAETKAASILSSAKLETERMEKSSIDAIKQAGRNILISFRDGVAAQLSAVINRETAKAYDGGMLKTLIPETVKNWVSNGNAEDISVLLSPKDLETLEAGFKAALKDEISRGLVIKSDDSIDSGFKIGVDNGAAYYDFSSEAVAQMFATYLNPKTALIMKEAAGQWSDK